MIRVERDTAQVLTGSAGVVGAVVLAALTIVPDAHSTALTLLGGALIGVCEAGLLILLIRVRPAWSIAIAFVLGTGALVSGLGWLAYLTAGSLAGIGLAAIGLIPWVVAAPLLAAACARAGLLSWAPAAGLVVLTVTLVPFSTVEIPTFLSVLYLAVWAWVGVAMANLRVPTNSKRTV